MSSIESQWSADSDGQKKKEDKPADGRWIRPPMSLDKIVSKAEEDDDDEDEEEEKKPNADDAEAVAEETEETEPAAEQPPEEVFETITAAEKDAELMEIPRIEDDKPSVALTPEESKTFNEMVADFGPPVESDDLERKDIPPIPSWDMPTVEHPRKDLDEAPPEPASASGGTPFWRPAPTPTFSEVSARTSSTVESDPVPAAPRSGGEASSGVTAILETLKAATNLAELANNPHRLIARELMQAAVRGYLDRHKQERYGSEPLLRQQREEIGRLHDEQRRINERLVAGAQHEAISPNEQLEIFDQDGNRIILQPGWQVKRSPAGYSFVVDQHNRVVHNAIHYGEAFLREQRREQLSDDLFAKLGGGPSGGAQNDRGFAAPFPTLGQTQVPQQVNSQFTLPPSQPNEIDLNHRLPEPRNYLGGAITSPWLWTAVAILIIVYFVAQLA